jgi:hypothetical protein
MTTTFASGTCRRMEPAQLSERAMTREAERSGRLCAISALPTATIPGSIHIRAHWAACYCMECRRRTERTVSASLTTQSSGTVAEKSNLPGEAVRLPVMTNA